MKFSGSNLITFVKYDNELNEELTEKILGEEDLNITNIFIPINKNLQDELKKTHNKLLVLISLDEFINNENILLKNENVIKILIYNQIKNNSDALKCKNYDKIHIENDPKLLNKLFIFERKNYLKNLFKFNFDKNENDIITENTLDSKILYLNINQSFTETKNGELENNINYEQKKNEKSEIMDFYKIKEDSNNFDSSKSPTQNSKHFKKNELDFVDKSSEINKLEFKQKNIDYSKYHKEILKNRNNSALKDLSDQCYQNDFNKIIITKNGNNNLDKSYSINYSSDRNLDFFYRETDPINQSSTTNVFDKNYLKNESLSHGNEEKIKSHTINDSLKIDGKMLEIKNKEINKITHLNDENLRKQNDKYSINLRNEKPSRIKIGKSISIVQNKIKLSNEKDEKGQKVTDNTQKSNWIIVDKLEEKLIENLKNQVSLKKKLATEKININYKENFISKSKSNNEINLHEKIKINNINDSRDPSDDEDPKFDEFISKNFNKQNVENLNFSLVKKNHLEYCEHMSDIDIFKEIQREINNDQNLEKSNINSNENKSKLNNINDVQLSNSSPNTDYSDHRSKKKSKNINEEINYEDNHVDINNIPENIFGKRNKRKYIKKNFEEYKTKIDERDNNFIYYLKINSDYYQLKIDNDINDEEYSKLKKKKDGSLDMRYKINKDYVKNLRIKLSNEI